MSDAYTPGPECSVEHPALDIIAITPHQRKWYTLEEIAEAVAKLALAKVEAAKQK